MAVAPGAWPWTTFAANVAGAFLLGLVATRWPPEARERAFLGAGLCGGLTTFATLQLELLRMLDSDHVALAAAYAAASLAAGFGALVAASRLAERAMAAT